MPADPIYLSDDFIGLSYQRGMAEVATRWEDLSEGIGLGGSFEVGDEGFKNFVGQRRMDRIAGETADQLENRVRRYDLSLAQEVVSDRVGVGQQSFGMLTEFATQMLDPVSVGSMGVAPFLGMGLRAVAPVFRGLSSYQKAASVASKAGWAGRSFALNSLAGVAETPLDMAIERWGGREYTTGRFLLTVGASGTLGLGVSAAGKAIGRGYQAVQKRAYDGTMGKIGEAWRKAADDPDADVSSVVEESMLVTRAMLDDTTQLMDDMADGGERVMIGGKRAARHYEEAVEAIREKHGDARAQEFIDAMGSFADVEATLRVGNEVRQVFEAEVGVSREELAVGEAAAADMLNPSSALDDYHAIQSALQDNFSGVRTIDDMEAMRPKRAASANDRQVGLEEYKRAVDEQGSARPEPKHEVKADNIPEPIVGGKAVDYGHPLVKNGIIAASEGVPFGGSLLAMNNIREFLASVGVAARGADRVVEDAILAWGRNLIREAKVTGKVDVDASKLHALAAEVQAAQSRRAMNSTPDVDIETGTVVAGQADDALSISTDTSVNTVKASVEAAPHVDEAVKKAANTLDEGLQRMKERFSACLKGR
jgi:hypothetical protein